MRIVLGPILRKPPGPKSDPVNRVLMMPLGEQNEVPPSRSERRMFAVAFASFA